VNSGLISARSMGTSNLNARRPQQSITQFVSSAVFPGYNFVVSLRDLNCVHRFMDLRVKAFTNRPNRFHSDAGKRILEAQNCAFQAVN
jgi:hypothetical protein